MPKCCQYAQNGKAPKWRRTKRNLGSIVITIHLIVSLPNLSLEVPADLPHHLRHATPNPTQAFHCEVRELLPFEQTPMERGRELLRERVADLMLGVNIQELELVENGAVVAQRLERDVDVLDLRVLARVLDLLDARLVVFEEYNRAGLTVPSGVELGVELLEPGGFASGFI